MSKVVYNSENRITQNYQASHGGVDIGFSSNEEYNKVYPNCKGEVVEIQDGLGNLKGSSGVQSWGNYVLVKHANGMHSRYAHLKAGILVKKGDTVDENTQLGVIGESGNAYGRHLHFEVATGYSSTTRIDPTPYLTKAIYEEVKEETSKNRVNELLNGSTNNSVEIKVGDSVIVNGYGTASSNGSGAKTKTFTNQTMKVIKINEGAVMPYALNQYNQNSGVTAWFSKSSCKKG